MSESYFERLAPFIRDYIYRNRWEEIRDIQVAACDVIFNTDSNLLLASGTASGKTEAAFLPVITKLYEKPSKSIGILYISPLKALINDQFNRIEELLEFADIPVFKWHGDVSQYKKNQLVRNPQGVLQTTPESLEAMLIRRVGDVTNLFSDLRYIVIDEVHYFMSEDRGIQLQCILERIQRITNNIPIRIGLSATLGEYQSAEKWLTAGTQRNCVTPTFQGGKRKIRLFLEHFPLEKENDDASKFYTFLYQSTYGKKSLIFSNSRAEIEDNMAHVKREAKRRNTKDVYFAHHGNVSTTLRQRAEEEMKESELPTVTGSTVTLELGIDLGQLERIVQTGSPFSVSSFVQRLGRSGRRGEPSQMWFAFKEIMDSKVEIYKRTNWEFIMCIAMIQLYIEEKWIEPISENSLPYGLLYHQTMSHLATAGGVSAAKLAQTMLTLSPFKNISQEDYKKMLQHMLQLEHIEMDDSKKILIGLEGERSINRYDFYAVFATEDEYSVKYKSEEIGTIHKLYPVNTRFALAGYTWEVTEIDTKSKIIYVNKVDGLSTNSWVNTGSMAIHTKVLKKMKDILESTVDYGYLGEDAKLRLGEMRCDIKKSNLLEEKVVPISPSSYAVFPFLGTKAMNALSYSLSYYGLNNTIYFDSVIPVCILIKTTENREEIKGTLERIRKSNLDKAWFNVPSDAAIIGKYNDFIPSALLRKQYIMDYVDEEDMRRNL